MRNAKTKITCGPGGSAEVERSHWNLAPDALVVGGVILLLNLPLLLTNQPAHPLFYLAENVGRGEWWRLLTHPWAHVSRYHFFLDYAALMILYSLLDSWSVSKRLGSLALIAFASSGSAILFSESVRVYGLCGLSGLAHGLTALVALVSMGRQERFLQFAGAALLAGIALKSGWEVRQDSAVLEFLHGGRAGIPIAIAHLGGLAGGILAHLSFAEAPTRS